MRLRLRVVLHIRHLHLHFPLQQLERLDLLLFFLRPPPTNKKPEAVAPDPTEPH